MSFSETVLNTPIIDLDFSATFKQITAQLGFQTLADLLKKNLGELVKLPGFTYRLKNEYIGFLESRELGSYLN